MSRWALLKEFIQFYDGKLEHSEEMAFVVSHMCFIDEGFLFCEQNQVKQKDFFPISPSFRRVGESIIHLRQR